jgi:Permease family
MVPARVGFLPSWTLGTRSVIAPEERLPWGQIIALGLQHSFAMFGATVLAPILMGFDPNIAILFSGMGTLLFFFVVRARCRGLELRLHRRRHCGDGILGTRCERAAQPEEAVRD